MTEGEKIFYLRELRRKWTSTRLSAETLSSLESAKLIEQRGGPSGLVRLTAEGYRSKAASRPRHTNARVQLQDMPRLIRRRSKKVLPPKSLA
jgi:hypothetical protein